MNNEILAAAKQLRIGIGFDKSRAHGWYIRIKGKKSYYADEAAQDLAVQEKIAEIRLMGVDALDVTTTDRHAILEMQRRATTTGLTPLEIFERGFNVLSLSPKASPGVADCAEEFVAAYEKRRIDGDISSVRLYEARSIVRSFAATCRGLKMGVMTRGHVDAFLGGLDVGKQTRRNRARIIRRFFNWAKEHGYTSHNPVPTQRPIQREPVVWTPKQIRMYIAAAYRVTPTLVPMIALRWFAGIRPNATTLMRWDDVNFAERRIAVRASINKLRVPDIIEGLPDQIWVWLKKHRKKTGYIADTNHRKLIVKLHKSLGYSRENRWPEDVARHSFASHSLPLDGIEKTKSMMLHRTSATTLKFYLVKNVSRKQAKEYRSILPKEFRRDKTSV